eukprot:403352014
MKLLLQQSQMQLNQQLLNTQQQLLQQQQQKQLLLSEQQSLDINVSQHLAKYEKLRITYEKQESILKQRAIKRLSIHYSLEREKLAQLPLYKQMLIITNVKFLINFSQYFKLVMLNETEIACWEIINDEMNISLVKNKFFLQRIMMTALLAKKYSNDENVLQVYYSFLNHNYPKFMESYKVWESITRITPESITVDKINEHFNRLFGDPVRGSNYYVADTETDYNYIQVLPLQLNLPLEDEHERRAVHTTKEPKHREITEQYSEHYNRSLRTHQDYINIDSTEQLQRSRSRSPSEISVTYVSVPIKRGRPSKKDIENKQQIQSKYAYVNHNSKEATIQDALKNKINRQDQKAGGSSNYDANEKPRLPKNNLMHNIQQQAQNQKSGNTTTINNISISNSTLNFSSLMFPKAINPQVIQKREESSKDSRFNISPTGQQEMPDFKSQQYCAESFGNVTLTQQKKQNSGSGILNDLLMKKQQEQNSREVYSFQKKLENNSLSKVDSTLNTPRQANESANMNTTASQQNSENFNRQNSLNALNQLPQAALNFLASLQQQQQTYQQSQQQNQDNLKHQNSFSKIVSNFMIPSKQQVKAENQISFSGAVNQTAQQNILRNPFASRKVSDPFSLPDLINSNMENQQINQNKNSQMPSFFVQEEQSHQQNE